MPTKNTTAKKSTKTKTTANKKAVAKKRTPKKATKAGDREVTMDRRRKADRRKSDDKPSAEEPAKLERRQKVQRRRQIDPTTCERDYSEGEVQFMNAMDEYKRKSGRMFPTCSEVLEVVRSLGYVQLTPAELALVRPEEAAASEELTEPVEESSLEEHTA